MTGTLTRRGLLRLGSMVGAASLVPYSAAALQSSAPSTSASRDLLQQPVQIPPNFVGMHFHRWPAGQPLSPAPTYGYGSVRSHDYVGLHKGIAWYSIHLGPNSYDWSQMDVWVQTHASARKTLLYTVFGTPAWITSSAEHSDPYGRKGGAEAPIDLQPLHDFVHALVSRYNSRGTQIQFIEVWNEPHFERHFDDFWWGTAEQLAAMGRVIYQAAKSADPHIQVLSPGFVPGASTPLTGNLTLNSNSVAAAQNSSLCQYLLAFDGVGSTAARWCDGISFHAYNARVISPTQGIEGELLLLNQLQALLHLSLPVYISECGFQRNSPFPSLSLADQATALRRLAVVIASCGVRTLYFYSHDDAYIGNPSINPPIAQAIQDIHQHIAGSRLNQVTILSNGSYRITTGQQQFLW